MTKKLVVLLTSLVLATLLAVGIYAAETKTVTIGGSELLTTAIDMLGDEGGTIVVNRDLYIPTSLTIPEISGDITITGSTIHIGGDIIVEKNTNDNVITFDAPLNVTAESIRMFGGFNSIVFGENFEVTGKLDFFGGVDTPLNPKGESQYADMHYELNIACVTELPYSITVNGGTFNTFAGGNYREDNTAVLGSIAAPITITVTDGVFGGGVTFDANSALKAENAFSISGMSTLADDATLVIEGGTFNLPIYAQGWIGETSTRTSAGSVVLNSDKKYYAIDGDISITVSGGNLGGCEINAFQNNASYCQLLRGNYTVTVGEGATLASGMVIDATQVKTYAGASAVAKLYYPEGADVSVKRFDYVNDIEITDNVEPLRIACIGDSITQGTGVSRFSLDSYPAQLYKQAVSEGKDVIIANYGCGATKVINYSGLWYNYGLAYTLSRLETDADYVIIGLGTNDAHTTQQATGQQEQFYNMYSDLAMSYEELDTTKMVYGTSAIFRNTTDISAACVIRPLQEKALTDLKAAGKNCTYIDLYALTLDAGVGGDLLLGNIHTLTGDLIHPDKGGYTIYADKIFNAVFNGECEVEDFEMTDVYVSASGSNNAECTLANPTNNLSVALAKVASGGTVHIIGEYKYEKLGTYIAFNTPLDKTQITIAGYGSGAVLNLSTKVLYVNNDIVFDNITVKYSEGTALYLALGYNNAELTSTSVLPYSVVCGGFLTYSNNSSRALYSTPTSVSSDKDCTISLLGSGKIGYIMAGNLHYPGNTAAIYGTYSGDMELNLGGSYTFASGYYDKNGINGMNYLSGNITANISNWGGSSIKDYAEITWDSTLAADYDESNNTGTVTVNVDSALGLPVTVTGDFDADGDRDLADTLALIGYYANGMDSAKSTNFYERTEVTLAHLLRAIKALAK